MLRDARVTSTLIGASSVQQLEDNVAAAQRLDFTDDELAEIDRYAVESGVDQWAGARQATDSAGRPPRRRRGSSVAGPNHNRAPACRPQRPTTAGATSVE